MQVVADASKIPSVKSQWRTLRKILFFLTSRAHEMKGKLALKVLCYRVANSGLRRTLILVKFTKLTMVQLIFIVILRDIKLSAELRKSVGAWVLSIQ